VPELGLFPLPLVLVPTERIPLHIFEPRYRELIGECLESDGEFGVVLATGDGAVHEIGTRAHVIEVLDTLEDGSMNVVIEGGERFRLLELTSGRSFVTGVVEAVTDDDEPPVDVQVAEALAVFRRLVASAESDMDVPSDDAEQLDFELAARVDFGIDAKQELLASTSPQARAVQLVELLNRALEAVRLERMLRRRARANGQTAPFDPNAN